MSDPTAAVVDETQSSSTNVSDNKGSVASAMTKVDPKANESSPVSTSPNVDPNSTAGTPLSSTFTNVDTKSTSSSSSTTTSSGTAPSTSSTPSPTASPTTASPTPKTLAPSPTASPTTAGPTPGALAGGIVGAFLGGVILALMAAYFINRRRKSSPYNNRSSKGVESAHGTSTRKSLRSPTVTNAWERLIPQPVDDETMGSLVKSLLDRVVLHVDNFYTRTAVQISTSDLELFAKVDTKLLPGPIAEVMTDSTMQMLAIKHCIAFALTDSITPGDDPSNKILPIYLAVLPRKLAPNAGSDNDMKAERQAYAIWKSITARQLPKLADEPTLAAHRRRVTASIIDDISAAFRGWEVSSLDNGELAAQNLAEIVGVAFDVGMRIASQACTFEFDKHYRRRRAEETEGFVVLPGFNKVVDERGNLIGGQQVLIRPTTHRPRRDR